MGVRAVRGIFAGTHHRSCFNRRRDDPAGREYASSNTACKNRPHRGERRRFSSRLRHVETRERMRGRFSQRSCPVRVGRLIVPTHSSTCPVAFQNTLDRDSPRDSSMTTLKTQPRSRPPARATYVSPAAGRFAAFDGPRAPRHDRKLILGVRLEFPQGGRDESKGE